MYGGPILQTFSEIKYVNGFSLWRIRMYCLDGFISQINSFSDIKWQC